ncbi:WXG100 family type VII secretion target [Williamsia sp. MIQD14]|uniref:WXG100 family type VII secretion target n=1 Tax=Williamsia sp. MIQD14 TaxID=3425703 RepID=UPI003D9FB764
MPDDELTVDAADLGHAASQIDSARAGVHDAAATAYAAFDAEASGWVGDSKKALENAVRQLTEHSDHLAERLDTQSHRINYAADRYAETERRNAERLGKVDAASKPRLNLDH